MDTVDFGDYSEEALPEGEITPADMFDWLAQNVIPVRIEATPDLCVRWTLFNRSG